MRGINVDLIYGLPHQTAAMLTSTIGLCAEMHPDRMALFGYAHVPWMAKNQRMIPQQVLPGVDERFDQARQAAMALVDAGYVQIGLDHFALPDDPLANAAKAGNLHRNFQGYTTDRAQTLLGVGATSIGRTPAGFVQNKAETGAWTRDVRAGILPVGKGHEFVRDDALRGEVIEHLMCFGTVNLQKVSCKHNAPAGWYRNELLALEPYIRDGIVHVLDDEVRMSEQGRPLVRVVASKFDAYLAAKTAAHSIAV